MAMQLAERDGIACDHCGTTYRHDFTYYSFDFRSVAVTDNRKPSLEIIFSSQVIFSIDTCSACFDKVKNLVIQNYNKIMSPQRRVRVETVCELSGEIMVGSYTYYHIEVIKVDVKTIGQPNVCIQCKTKTFDDGKPCSKCGSVRFIRPAIVAADRRFVELAVCENMYKRLTETAATIRQVAGQWATKT
jgi:hypothetical protein